MNGDVVSEVRHFTASAVVFDAAGRVLLAHHVKSGLWLYPGGHVEPDEDPAQAALREVREETGVTAEMVGVPGFTHPAVVSHPVPFALVEMDVADRKFGPHRHIDFVYVMRASSVRLTPRPGEVHEVRWVPLADVAARHVPAELPALILAASQFGDHLTPAHGTGEGRYSAAACGGRGLVTAPLTRRSAGEDVDGLAE